MITGMKTLYVLIDLSEERNREYMRDLVAKESITNSDSTYTIGIESVVGVMYLYAFGIMLSKVAYMVETRLGKSLRGFDKHHLNARESYTHSTENVRSIYQVLRAYKCPKRQVDSNLRAI